ncbi:MAG: helix-turn-helix domain-containing protein, partial [Firmicutes bacterium]|nr:helix-turn-helix domain-containing protein [Bacillota bacterium]
MNGEFIIYVVDDECLIAQSLAKMIRRAFGELVSVSAFFDPQNLINQMKTQPCDLVIADIRMPGMSGLEMIAVLRAMHYDFEAIMLTGYDVFEYAYEAIRQNTCGYLLKNETDERVQEEIQKALDKIREKLRFENHIRQANREYQTLHRQYVRQMVRDHLLAEIPDWPKDLWTDMPVHIVLGFDTAQHGRAGYDAEILLRVVEDTIRDCVQLDINFCESFLIRQNYVWLFSLKHEEAAQQRIYAAIDSVQKMVTDHFLADMLFIIGRGGVLPDGIYAQYERLCSVKLYNLLMHQSGIATEQTDDMKATGAALASERRLAALPKACLSCLEDQQADALHENLELLRCYFVNHGEEDRLTAMALYMETLHGLIGFMQKHKLVQKLPPDALVKLQDVSATMNWQMKAQLMQSVFEELNNLCSAGVYDRLARTTEQIKRYIQENIASDLSATALAQQFGYSEAYLSRIFKESEHTTLHGFVQECRMQQARALLRSTNDKVYAIACRCGYNNTAYFIRVFKSCYGIAPQKYRDTAA